MNGRSKRSAGFHVRNALALVGVLTMLGLVSACFSSSSAGSGGNNTNTADVTDAEFAALQREVTDLKETVATLEGAVETLRASVRVVTTADGSGTAGAGMQKFASSETAVPVGCSLDGFFPSSQRLGNYLQCQSEAGVLYLAPIQGGAPGYQVATYHMSADCSGQPYAHTSDFGAFARKKGAIINNHGVFYMPGGATPSMGSTGSLRDNTGACQTVAFNFVTPVLVSLQPNDPGVTQVDNTLPPLDVN